MISRITTGRGLEPIGNSQPYITLSGIVSYDGPNQKTKIIDPATGAHQDIYEQVYHIQLSHDVMDIINWADTKKQQEEELKLAIENNAAVKEAYSQLQMLITLSK